MIIEANRKVDVEINPSTVVLEVYSNWYQVNGEDASEENLEVVKAFATVLEVCKNYCE